MLRKDGFLKDQARCWHLTGTFYRLTGEERCRPTDIKSSIIITGQRSINFLCGDFIHAWCFKMHKGEKQNIQSVKTCVFPATEFSFIRIIHWGCVVKFGSEGFIWSLYITYFHIYFLCIICVEFKSCSLYTPDSKKCYDWVRKDGWCTDTYSQAYRVGRWCANTIL